MTTLPLKTPLSQDAPSPGAAAVATRAPFGTDPSGNEAFLAVAQSLSHTGSFGWSVASGELDWSAETFNIFEHDRAIKPTLEMILSRIHPDDRDLVQRTLDRVLETKDDFDLEHRLLMPDGSVKHLHVLARALTTPSGNLEFVGAVTDVTKQVQTETTLEKALQEIKRRNEALRASEHNLDLIINTIPALAWSARPDGSAEFFNQHYLEYVGLSAEQVKDWGWTVAVHPDDLNGLAGSWQSIMASGERGESEARLRRFDGEYRWFLFRANPLRDEFGNIVNWFGINTDIEDRKLAEEALRRSEGYLVEAQRLTHTGSWAWNVSTRHRSHWSPENYRMFGFDPGLGLPSDEALSRRIHPEDLDRVRREAFPMRTAKGASFDVEYRIVLPDRAIKHLHSVGHPVLNDAGDLVEFVGTTVDITERKQAEDKIREQEVELRQTLDAATQYLSVLNAEGSHLYMNQCSLDFLGVTLEEWQKRDIREFVHLDDVERVAREIEQALSSGSALEIEARFLRYDGEYRWLFLHYKPLKDQLGHITRWVVPAIDIHDRKRSEERLQYENVALREEIDRSSMFEELVGSCEPMRQVLKQVEKVAPSDATVLIQGETGTGKELIARALHRRSKRAARAFIRVNCAAIPQSLIASELFGHEKGAREGSNPLTAGHFFSMKSAIFQWRRR